ncbi:putative membrane protein [Peptoniphilus sp. ING2-D1G]|nr:putative membrane protein [Peptoniphilus sp. ING2-D1G]
MRKDDYSENNEFQKFLNSEDLDKLKNVFSKVAKLSIEGINNFVESQTKRRETDIIPVKNERLVDQSPREEKTARIYLFILNVLRGVHVVIAAILGIAFVLDPDPDYIKILLAYFAPIILLTTIGVNKNKKSIDRMKRYRKYLSAFKNATVATVEDMALMANTTEKTVVDDIKNFIDKEYLKEARLIENNNIAVLDNKTFVEYKKYYVEDDFKKSLEGTTIEAEYTAQLLKYKKILPEPVKSYAEELLQIFEKFYTNINQEGQSKSRKADYEKFKNYYLPETIKLFSEYEKICNSEVQLEDERVLKIEIEEALREILNSFRNLLETTFETNYMDIKSDISVLKSMLKKEGYMEEDFK